MARLQLDYDPDRHVPVRFTRVEATALVGFLEVLRAYNPDHVARLWPHAVHTNGLGAVVRVLDKLNDAVALYIP